MKPSKLIFSKINTLIKKNLEFVFLIFIALTVIILIQTYNFIKDQKKNHFFNLLNNLYFEKTLNSVIDNLDPKYVNIDHKVLSGENFSSILEKYEIPKGEINTIEKLLSKKQNLNKFKKNQLIKFTLDLGVSKKNSKPCISCFKNQKSSIN